MSGVEIYHIGFDGNSRETALEISLSRTDRVFVWGDSPTDGGIPMLPLSGVFTLGDFQ